MEREWGGTRRTYSLSWQSVIHQRGDIEGDIQKKQQCMNRKAREQTKCTHKLPRLPVEPQIDYMQWCTLAAHYTPLHGTLALAAMYWLLGTQKQQGNWLRLRLNLEKERKNQGRQGLISLGASTTKRNLADIAITITVYGSLLIASNTFSIKFIYKLCSHYLFFAAKNALFCWCLQESSV